MEKMKHRETGTEKFSVHLSSFPPSEEDSRDVNVLSVDQKLQFLTNLKTFFVSIRAKMSLSGRGPTIWGVARRGTLWLPSQDPA